MERIIDKGHRIYHKNRIYDIESFAKKAVNPIGAGDAFAAGFLYEIIGKHTVINSARFGAILGTYVFESEQIRVFPPPPKNIRRIKYQCHRIRIHFANFTYSSEAEDRGRHRGGTKRGPSLRIKGE